MDFWTNRCYTITTTLTSTCFILPYTHLKNLNNRLQQWFRKEDKTQTDVTQRRKNNGNLQPSMVYEEIHITGNDKFEITRFSGQTTNWGQTSTLNKGIPKEVIAHYRLLRSINHTDRLFNNIYYHSNINKPFQTHLITRQLQRTLQDNTYRYEFTQNYATFSKHKTKII